MTDQKKKKENRILLVLKFIFVYNIEYKIFALICGFLFWLLLSISL
jgi:hypothetical protein